MHCEMKLADWYEGESTQAGNYALHRGEVVKLEPKQVTDQLTGNPALQLTWVYTKEELEKLPTMELNSFLQAVKKTNDAKRARKAIFDALEEEAKL